MSKIVVCIQDLTRRFQLCSRLFVKRLLSCVVVVLHFLISIIVKNAAKISNKVLIIES